MNPIGKLFVIAGVILIIFGVAFLGKLGPLGRLSGDIAFERPNFSLYFPLATGIILSIILSIIFWLIRK